MSSRHAPPKTRFGPAAAQPKGGSKPVAGAHLPQGPRAAGQPPALAAPAPPPTKYGPTGAAQAKSATPAHRIVPPPPTKFGSTGTAQSKADGAMATPGRTTLPPPPTKFAPAPSAQLKGGSWAAAPGQTHSRPCQPPLSSPPRIGKSVVQKTRKRDREEENDEENNDEIIRRFLSSVGENDLYTIATAQDLACWNFALHALGYDRSLGMVSPDDEFTNLGVRNFAKVKATQELENILPGILRAAGYTLSETGTDFKVCMYLKKPKNTQGYPVSIDHWWISAYGVTLETFPGMGGVQIYIGDQKNGHWTGYIHLEFNVTGLTPAMVTFLASAIRRRLVKKK